MIMITIFDLDNCISNDLHRLRHIDHSKASAFDRYHNYHLLSAFDQFWNTSVFRRHEVCGDRIVIATARPEHYRALTVGWFRRHNARLDLLLMRNDEDERGSVDVKRDFLLQIDTMFGLSNVSAAYDDRPDVIEMYKSFNLQAKVLCCYVQDR